MPEKFSPKVLEIGFGHRPAIDNGGLLFEDPNVQYIGIDLFGEDKSTNIRAVEWTRRKRPDAHFLQANADALPLQDNSVDFVIMRSLFGQFTDSPSRWVSDINSIRDRGLFEAFRVLKPGGKIVVLEENTPWESHDVEIELKNAGFSVNEFAFQEKPFDELPEDNPWKKLRSPYFNIDSTMGGPSRYYGAPYIMIGIKPKNPKYETIEREIWEKDSSGKSVVKIRTYIKGEENTEPPITPQPNWR